MKKVVLYARAWPSDNDGKEKIKKQLEYLRRYCEKENLIVWETYEDITDAYTQNYMDFLGKINGVKSGRGCADILLVANSRLLAKNILDTVITTNLFRSTKLEIWHFAQQSE